MGLFTPWKSKNAEKRKKWIIDKANPENTKHNEILKELSSDYEYDIRNTTYKKLGIENSLDALVDIAKSDINKKIREAAIEKLSDQELLLDILKNEKDISVRKKIIEKLTDQKVLSIIAKNENDIPIRVIAIEKITDQKILTDITTHDSESLIRFAAIKNLTDKTVLIEVSKNDVDYELRKFSHKRLGTENSPGALLDLIHNDTRNYAGIAAIEKLNDQKTLEDLSKHSECENIRKAAVEKLTDQSVLSNIAKFDKVDSVRKAAIRKLTNQEVLSYYAKNEIDYNIRKEAVERLNDQNVLGYIVQNDWAMSVREAALSKLSDKRILEDITNNCKEYHIRRMVYKKLGEEESQKSLADIAQNDEDFAVRESAIEKLTDKSLLSDIAKQSEDYVMRSSAYKKLGKEESKESLNDIAINDKDYINRKNAYKKLGKEDCKEAIVDQVIEFMKSIKRGDVNRLQKMKINNIDTPLWGNGITSLHVAVILHANNAELIKYLIEYKHDINCKTELGITPLMIAAFNNNANMIKLLIESGADNDIQDENGFNAGEYYTERGNKEMDKLLGVIKSEPKSSSFTKKIVRRSLEETISNRRAEREQEREKAKPFMTRKKMIGEIRNIAHSNPWKYDEFSKSNFLEKISILDVEQLKEISIWYKQSNRNTPLQPSQINIDKITRLKPINWIESILYNPTCTVSTISQIKELDKSIEHYISLLKECEMSDDEILFFVQNFISAACPNCRGGITGDVLQELTSYKKTKQVIMIDPAVSKLLIGECPHCNSKEYLLIWHGN